MGEMADYYLDQVFDPEFDYSLEETLDDAKDGCWLPQSYWQKKYRKVPRKAGPVPPCPKCGKPCKLRTGKYGQFYGCSQFPKCKGSCDV